MKPMTVIRLLVSISGIMFLFGLTWLFAVFTFQIAGDNVSRTIFQILFTVFASFQGFFIFLFFVIFNREARESWKEFVSCGHYKSPFLHPSQYKNTSSAGTQKAHKKINTGSTGLTTNSYGKFDSEASPSPLPKKRDLTKDEEVKGDILLKTADEDMKLAEEGVSTVAPPNIFVESNLDEEDRTAPNWSDAEPVGKARVKRYSTKKHNMHHVEEYQVDFDSSHSGEEEDPEV